MMMVLPFLLKQKPLPWGGVWGRLFLLLEILLAVEDEQALLGVLHLLTLQVVNLAGSGTNDGVLLNTLLLL